MVWNKGPHKFCKRGHELSAAGRGKDGRCLLCRRDRVKRWIKLNRYGISQALYDQMTSLQNNKCAICDDHPKEESVLQIDHCHFTGKIRGLLCRNCNFILGLAKDNAGILRRAAEYLSQ